MVESVVQAVDPSSWTPLKNSYELRSRIFLLSTRASKTWSLFSKKALSP
eukprot:COSAG02_NODE_20365_length_835_cov_0.869565_1_plen_48_part_10